MTHDLKKFLTSKASDYISEIDNLFKGYREDVNPDAIDEDLWLQKGTSWVWKVGTLTLFDENERYFGRAYLGMQKHPAEEPVLIGVLEFREGENDDCGRVMQRLLRCMAEAESSFEDALR